MITVNILDMNYKIDSLISPAISSYLSIEVEGKNISKWYKVI